jgi:hypothetical protein
VHGASAKRAFALHAVFYLFLGPLGDFLVDK